MRPHYETVSNLFGDDSGLGLNFSRGHFLESQIDNINDNLQPQQQQNLASTAVKNEATANNTVDNDIQNKIDNKESKVDGDNVEKLDNNVNHYKLQKTTLVPHQSTGEFNSSKDNVNEQIYTRAET